MDDALLRAVSRTFYLTIRLLPAEVRKSIALGYLLARASDSIADASTAPVSRRIEALQGLRELDFGERALGELVRHQTVPSEAVLLERLPDLLDEMERSSDREAIAEVWQTILQGQIFDLVRFSVESSAPLNDEELDQYVYWVAGSVGAFWTRLCARRLNRFTDRPIEEMVALGVRFGKGLQLVNILRDRDDDRARGRVYVEDRRFGVVRSEAEAHLAAGLRWVEGVGIGRLRFACLPPIRIGNQMLHRMRIDGPAVKLPRREVRRIVFGCLPAWWSRRVSG